MGSRLLLTLCAMAALAHAATLVGFTPALQPYQPLAPVFGNRTLTDGSVVGQWIVDSNVGTPMRVFGSDFTTLTTFAFSSSATSCEDRMGTTHAAAAQISVDNTTAVIDVLVPESAPGAVYYFCVDGNHAGQDIYLTFAAQDLSPPPKEHILPLPLQISILIVLLSLSATFSGLNLGLMTLNTTDLRIIMQTGSEKQKKYAETIYPVRKMGNYLLCTVLLGNVLVNNCIAILLDDLTSGLVAVIGATAAIVVFGEITPQAVCSRHGLAVGAKTIWVTRFFMVVLAPAAWPISLILNKALGAEVGATYRREELKMLLKEQQDRTDIAHNEVAMMSSLLDFRSRRVDQIMTRLADVFMLDVAAKADYTTLAGALAAGYSRIPVYDGHRDRVVGIVLLKDLFFASLISQAERTTTLREIMTMFDRRVTTVVTEDDLGTVLETLRTRGCHLCVVQPTQAKAAGDGPVENVVGVITLEDVVETMVGFAIHDESDVPGETRSRKAPHPLMLTRPLRSKSQLNELPPPLITAAIAYLSATPPFSTLTPEVLKSLLESATVVRFTRDHVLYRRGDPADQCSIVLEGIVHVVSGSDSMAFDRGIFSTLGQQALMMTNYVPDFTATGAGAGMVLCIAREPFRAAQATATELQARAAASAAVSGGTGRPSTIPPNVGGGASLDRNPSEKTSLLSKIDQP